MKTFFSNSYKFLNASLCLCLIFVLGSCQKEEVNQDKNFATDAKAKIQQKKSGAAETAEFPTFHQGFNADTHPWADNSMTGFWGWCGTVDLQNKKDSDLKPSAGVGYATVMFGSCNDYWTAEFGEASGPATFDAALWSQSWPESGFIHELDIYLDADQYDLDNGLAFAYANSLYYSALAYPFIYFGLNVEKVDGTLEVNSFPVPEEGWYTFREVFGQDGNGNLTVDFELLDDGKLLNSFPMETTLGGNAASSYDAEALGSGYIWFPFIADGVELAIDEYRLRPGK